MAASGPDEIDEEISFPGVFSPEISNPRRQRCGYALVAVVGVLAVLPLWIPVLPAMCDAPQNAAQVAIYERLNDAGFAYAKLFEAHRATPNLAGYALLGLFEPLLGWAGAAKMAMSLALWGVLMATAWLLEEFGSDVRLALLAVVGLYGLPTQLGFIAFLAATPLAFGFLIAYLRYLRRPTLRRAACLVLLFVAVFLCHALMAALAAALGMVYALVDLHSARELPRRWLPVLGPVTLAGLWWVYSVVGRPFSHTAGRSFLWALNTDRAEMFTLLTGFSGQTAWGDCLAAFCTLLAVTPLMVLLGLRWQKRYFVLFASCMGIMLLAPESFMHVTCLYKRYVIFLLPMGALTLRPLWEVSQKRARLALFWLLLVALGWSGGWAWRMERFEDEARGFRTILAQMEPGQRVLSLNYERYSKQFRGFVFLHFPSWYSSLKGGIVDPSFATGNVDLVLYRPEVYPPVRFDDFEFHPQDFDWTKHEGWQYRYFVVHDRSSHAEQFAKVPATVILKAHDQDWWLWENPATPPHELAHKLPRR